MSQRDGLLQRLERVQARLAAQARGEFLAGALTAPDPPTGERWAAGQVWAHLAEFIPYWLEEAAHVIGDGHAEPVPFGRTKSDPARIAAIERDRSQAREALWGRVAADMALLHSFLEGMRDEAWSARGRHPTLGVMDLAGIINEFLVGHLEEHADQLDQLAASSAAG